MERAKRKRENRVMREGNDRLYRTGRQPAKMAPITSVSHAERKHGQDGRTRVMGSQPREGSVRSAFAASRMVWQYGSGYSALVDGQHGEQALDTREQRNKRPGRYVYSWPLPS